RAVRIAVKQELRIRFAGQTVGADERRERIAFASSFQADGSAIVPPVRHETLLAFLQHVFAVEAMRRRPGVVVLRRKKAVTMIEHLGVKGQLPADEKILEGVVAGRSV